MQINELLSFKEEMFKELRKTEKSILDKFNKKISSIEDLNTSLSSKLIIIQENNKSLSDLIATQKFKVQKLDDFISFRNKIESFSNSHEMRINRITEEISRIRTKYDKLIIDNIFVPGYVGPSCQYRNLGEYLSFQINEYNRQKMEHVQIKKDFKEYKSKLDNIMKNVVSLLDKSCERCNGYTDSRIKNTEEFIELKYMGYDKENSEIKTKIHENLIQIDKDLKTASDDLEYVSKLKKQISEDIKNHNDYFNQMVTDLKNSTEFYNNSFKKIKDDIEKNDKALKDSVKDAFKQISEIRRKCIEMITTFNKMKAGNLSLKDVDTLDKQIFLPPFANENMNTNGINRVKTLSKKSSSVIKFSSESSPTKSILKKSNPPKENITYLCLDQSNKVNINVENKNENKTKINNKEEIVKVDNINIISNNIKKRKNTKEESFKIDNVYITNSNENKRKKDNKEENMKNDYINITKTIENVHNYKNSIENKIFESNKKPSIKTKKNSAKLLLQEYKKENDKILNKKLQITSIETSSKNIKEKQGIILKNIKNNINNNNIKCQTLSNTYHNGFFNKKKNFKSLKIISLSDNVKIKNISDDINDITSSETLQKKSIRIDLLSPLSSNIFKCFDKNKKYNEFHLPVKVLPAFGSTTYSFYDPKTTLSTSVKKNKKGNGKLSFNEVENNTSSIWE